MPEKSWDEFFERMRGLWRREIEQYLTSLNLSFKDVKACVAEAFKNELMSQYSEGLHLAKLRRQTDTTLAMRYGGVNRAQIARWFDKGQFISFESFCMVSAAEDTELPQGHLVALAAYRAAWQAWGKLSEKKLCVTDEQTLCLYHTMRCKEYAFGMATQNSRLLHRGAEVISDWVREEVRDSRTWTAPQLHQLFDTHGLDWIVIDEVLGYDWF